MTGARRVTERRRFRFLIAALVLAAAPVLARADDDKRRFLGDAEIRADVVGHDFKGYYTTGKPWAEDYDASGSLKYREPNIDIAGYWTLSEGVFCTFYRQQLGGGCWRVRRVSENCFEFYGASQGPGRTATDTGWTARGWKTKEAPTCGAPQIS